VPDGLETVHARVGVAPTMRPCGEQQAMPKLIWDENYWQLRAREARIMQSNLKNPECKRIMYGMMYGMVECHVHLAQLTRDFRAAANGPKPKASSGKRAQAKVAP